MKILAIVVCLTLSLLVFGPVIAAANHGNTFVVAPSGDTTGIMDTANIQQAIDNVIATGKGTVLLEEGDFYLCETLVGINFDGTFKGSGVGGTVLHSIEDFPALDIGNLGAANPRMLMFYQDEFSTSTAYDPYKIKLCDFTINVDKPTEAWYYGYFSAMNTVDIYGKIVDGWSDEASYFDATVKNVEFLGDTGDEYGLFGLSIQNALLIQGQWGTGDWNEPISGNYLVEGCYIRNSLGSTAMFGSFEDSNVRLVRNTYEGALIGPEMYELSNSQGEIAFNDVSGCAWFGTYVAHGIGGSMLEPGRVSIHHNDIECGPGATGIWMEDYLATDDFEGLSVLAHHNEITIDDPYSWGIFGYGVQDVMLVRNTISGYGEAGIITGIWGDAVGGWKMVLNDLSDLTVDAAAIWLGLDASDCWVLTKGDSNTVLDQGTGNHILLI